MSAKQIGGDHYTRFKIQPVEYAVANNLGFLEGCALKYITRHPFKGGAQDIHKAIHILELILQYHYKETSDVATDSKLDARVHPNETHREAWRGADQPYAHPEWGVR